jgi:nitrogen fixation-related uncharacterized protein
MHAATSYEVLRTLIGVSAYLVLLILVSKFQAHPLMKRAGINPFTASVAALLLLALLGMGTAWHKIESYKTRGVVTRAHVTGKFQQWRSSRFGGIEYVVDYEYSDASGGTHAGEDHLHREIWDPLSVGGTVEVKYLSDSPVDSAVNEWGGYYESIHVCITLALVSGGALWWGLKRSRQRHRRKPL